MNDDSSFFFILKPDKRQPARLTTPANGRVSLLQLASASFFLDAVHQSLNMWQYLYHITIIAKKKKRATHRNPLYEQKQSEKIKTNITGYQHYQFQGRGNC